MSARVPHAVKLTRGNVTHVNGRELGSYKEAKWARDAIEKHTGERGEVVKVLLSIPSGSLATGDGK